MNELKISEEISLPLEASTWVISYLAKRGAGKTYDAAVQAEEMLKAHIPIVVVDGMGIWWGLRVSADGKGEGLPVVVFGGEHADLPLVNDKAVAMAKAVVESNISCVLDLSGFSKYAMRRIVMDFLNELYRLNRVDRHVFIEESDMFAPQRPIGQDEALCLSAVDNFVRRGGNHNLGCTLITQRSAVLNKDILTQSDCLVILRTLAPQDKKAIQAWVEEQTDKDKNALREWYDSLKTLENGEAWVWHPEKPAIFVKTKYRHRETFHATREFIKSPAATQIVLMDVDDFIAKFKKVFEAKPEPTKPVKPSIQLPADIPLHIPKSTPVKVIKEVTVGVQEEVKPESTKNIEQKEVIYQSLPDIRINQLKPVLNIPVEVYEQPTSSLGKVSVILKNDALNKGRQDKWSINRIKSHIRDHGWSDDGVEDAVAQLVRWEILRKQSNNMLRFYPARIQVDAVETVKEVS